MMAGTADTSPRLEARIAGISYLVTFVGGLIALRFGRRFGMAPDFIADVAYVVVTLLFYRLFKPVSRNVSFVAALFSLAGCANGVLAMLALPHLPVNTLVFFGVYCLLLAYLIYGSTFLPRALSPLLALAGIGWLTFVYPPLGKQLSPWNLMPGMFGEGCLMVWLIVVGVNAERWHQQAGRRTISDSHAVGLERQAALED